MKTKLVLALLALVISAFAADTPPPDVAAQLAAKDAEIARLKAENTKLAAGLNEMSIAYSETMGDLNAEKKAHADDNKAANEKIFGRPLSDPISGNAIDPFAAPSRPVVTAPKKWQPVITLSGQSAKRSPPFTISSETWRARWSASGAGRGEGFFSATLDRSGKFVQILANTNNPGSDTNNGSATGTFTVDVNAAIFNWTLVIEVPLSPCRAAAPSRSYLPLPSRRSVRR